MFSLVAGGADARAGQHAPGFATMSIGAPAAAPSGFLEFCHREPAQCRPAHPAPFDAGAVERQATRLYWKTVFANQGADPVSAPTAAIAAPSSYRQPAGAGRDLNRAPSRSGPASLATSVAVSPAASEVAEPGAASVIALDRANWALLNAVNRAVNRRIRQMSDERAFGKADYWQAPTQDGAPGDCEDFVLAKRQALIEAGVPSTALSIAVVETRWGETHAVLLVAGDTGEYVMDNLSSWILRWDRVGYRWRLRQAPGKIFEWVNIAA